MLEDLVFYPVAVLRVVFVGLGVKPTSTDKRIKITNILQYIERTQFTYTNPQMS